MAAISIYEVLKEQARLGGTDANYYKCLPYYFKLIIDEAGAEKGSTATGEAIFPLPINPESFTYALPFASQVSPMQDSGSIIEEGGIVVGSIALAGTTGWKLRKIKDTSAKPGKSRWTGELPKQGAMNDEISGQMHLWRLLQRCFDNYSELKRNPAVATKTRLEFHSLKDALHLEIVPREVEVSRDRGQDRITYRYRITADAVGPAESNKRDEDILLADDRSILQKVQDGVANLRQGIALLRGQIDDATAAVATLKRNLTNVVNVVRDLGSIADAASDLVTGVESVCRLPAEFINACADAVDDLQELSTTVSGFPANVARSWADAGDALDMLQVAMRGKTEETFDDRAGRHAENLNPTKSDEQETEATEAALKGTSAAGTMSLADAYGTGARPGDVERDKLADQSPTMQQGAYRGFLEVILAEGETLETLATRYLGTPALWRDLAALNRLSPPYVSQGGRLPGTLIAGDPVAIPVAYSSAVPNQGAGAWGAGKSKIEELLGRDLKMVAVGDQFGWDVDYAHGQEDAQIVAGNDNLVQALYTRLRTERYTDQVFPALGLPRLVGNVDSAPRVTEARLALEQQILDDSRIEKINSMALELVADALLITIDAQPIGSDGNRVIPLTLG